MKLISYHLHSPIPESLKIMASRTFKMKSLLAVLIVVYISAPCFSQDNTFQKIDSTYLYANKLYRTNSDSAITVLKNIKDWVMNQGTDDLKADYYLNYYRILFYAKGNKMEALEALHNAKTHAKNHAKLAMVYNKFGQLHHRLTGYLDSSMFYQIKAVEHTKKSNDTYLLTHYYLDISDLYITLQDLPKAAEFVDKSLAIAREKGIRKDYGYSLYNAIKVFQDLNDTIKVNQLKEEYALFNANKDNKTVVAHQNTTFIADLVDKKSFLENSISKHSQAKDLTYLLTNSLILADQYTNEKNYDEAIKLLVDGLPFLQDSALLFRKDYFFKLKKLHTLSGKYQAALMYADTLLEIENQLLNDTKIETIKDLEARYNKLEQDNLITMLQKDKIISKRNLYIAILSMCVLFLLAIGLYYLYKQSKKYTHILEEKNKLIHSMLSEKDVLLREIHHRVKNNLQVVSSLLNLQGNFIKDKNALAAINEGKNRVYSMALIHKNLYSSDQMTIIDTKKYFDELVDQIEETYQSDRLDIRIQKNISSIYLDVDTMIPLGLIANEIISNAYKHAFKAKDKGTIFISLKQLDDDIVLSIKDNGIGMPRNHFFNSDSFGNRMIRTFVNKINGNLDLDGDDGSQFTLSFPFLNALEKVV